MPAVTVLLWQLTQVPSTSEWSTRVAGRQVAVAWQASQVSEVVMCAKFLPVARVPLWQPEQLAVMPVWSVMFKSSLKVTMTPEMSPSTVATPL